MKISLDWLREFVDLRVTDPQEIARRLTAGVAEVDEVEVQGRFLDGVVVGKVLTLEKHPEADRLSVCTVQTDKGIKHIVCGGTNLRVGMQVALAHVGASVSDGKGGAIILAKAKIRGRESEGMICSAEELDLESRFPPTSEQGARPILDLGDGNEGTSGALSQRLGLGDVVIHVDNHAITHRADLFSHIGFAREFVALGLATWKKERPGKKLAYPKTAMPFGCAVEDKTLVPRYEAALLEIDGLGTTPDWMKRRLEATGWRSISLPIDITNYVLLETGMPHHGFDADDFRGDIRIRRAKKGERITTLDGEDRALPEGALVISDDEGIFDLFGIMGGMRSSTKESTRRIYLQAGIPDPVAIRRTVIEMGHRTDAATVYEKGVPRIMAGIGLRRAVELFLELVPGARIASERVSWGDDGAAMPVKLPLERVGRMLGMTVSATEATRILESLEFGVKKNAVKRKGAPAVLTVTPPPHRLGDIRGPHDLVEEIGRVAGYDTIAPTLPCAETAPPQRDSRLLRLRASLKECRFSELVPLSLVGPSLLRACGLDPADAYAVESPLGEELSLLHTSTIPSLLAHAERNVLAADGILKTFHLAHVFSRRKGERAELSLLVADLAGAADASLTEEPLLVLKRDLAAAIAGLGYALDVAYAGTPPAAAHPGRYGEILARVAIGASRDGASAPSASVGTLYELHPDIRERFSLRHRAAVATLDLVSLLALPPRDRLAEPVPQFPAIRYDVTLPLSHREQAGDLLRRLRGAHPLLETVEVTNLYAGKALKKGDYHLTLRFTYRAADRTLSEDEAKPLHEKLLHDASVAGV